MRKFLPVTTVSAFALALSACGGAADEADAPAVSDESADLDAGEAEAGDATEDAAGEDSAEEQSPAPAASGSATPAPTPTPTPTRVAAAATPPASFTTCGVCHSINAGENRIGPSLAGVVGRRAGSVAGAAYSPGMQSVSLSWTEANLDRYLADPAGVVPGGTMPNPNLDAAQRRAIIDYLKML